MLFAWQPASLITRRRWLFFGLLGLGLVLLALVREQLSLYAHHHHKTNQLLRPSERVVQQLLTELAQTHSTWQSAFWIRVGSTDAQLPLFQLRRSWQDIRPLLDTLQYLQTQLQDKTLQQEYAQIRLSWLKLAQFTENSLKLAEEKQQSFSDSAGIALVYRARLAQAWQERGKLDTEAAATSLHNWLEKLQIEFDTEDFQLGQTSALFTWIIIVLAVTWFVALWLGLQWLRRSIAEDMALLDKTFATLLKGDFPEKPAVRNREFSPLGQAAMQLRSLWQDVQQFAVQAGRANFRTTVSEFNRDSKLGKAFMDMRAGLQTVYSDNAIRYWSNNGIALFSDINTRYAQDLPALADHFITELVRYLGINQGGFFTVEKEDHQEYLDLKASFAYDKKKYQEKRVLKGQGIVGQVWQEGERVYLKEIPEDYIEISSGLGEARPSVLLLIPLKAEKEVLGVIELASFHELEPYQIEFAEKVAENAGQVIANVRINDRTRRLLQETQALAETLQAQDEQMRQTVEELRDVQIKMSAAQKELATKEANLQAVINNTSHAILAFDRQFTITVLNSIIQNLYAEQGIKLAIGKNLIAELTDSDFVEHREEFKRVLQGDKFLALHEREGLQGQEFWEWHYNPIRNEENDVIGASIFMENLTQQFQAQARLESTESHLQALINNTQDYILAIDQEYRVLVANEVCQEELRAAGITLATEQNILEQYVNPMRQNWKNLYDRALAGERFVKVISQGEYPHKTYREYWFNPIRNDLGLVRGVSVFAHDITPLKRAEIEMRRALLDSLDALTNLQLREEEMQAQIIAYRQTLR